MRFRHALFLLPLLTLCGCPFAPRPFCETCYYTVEPPPPAARTAAPADLVVGVRPFEAASRYGERILYRPGGAEVCFHDCGRWAEPPAELLTAALRRALDAAHIARAIVDARAVPGADLIVEGCLTRFDEVHGPDGWAAECEIELMVRRTGEDKPVAVRRIAARHAAAEPTTPAFVAAMTAAVAEVLATATDIVAGAL